MPVVPTLSDPGGGAALTTHSVPQPAPPFHWASGTGWPVGTKTASTASSLRRRRTGPDWRKVHFTRQSAKTRVWVWSGSGSGLPSNKGNLIGI